MKNVDVPLWDKGDNTDNYTKGGGRANSMSFDGMIEADKNVLYAFRLVLGRKPSTREIAYYRISRMEKNDILLKLISGTEHKELVKNAKKFPELSKENSQLKSNILKLKSEYESRVKEYEDLNKLLKEKNNTITELRNTKSKPFITDEKVRLESANYNSKYISDDKSWWDKIIDLFFK